MNKIRKFKSRESKLAGEIVSLSPCTHWLVVRSSSDFRGKRTNYSVSIPQWKLVWWAWKRVYSFHMYLPHKIYLPASVNNMRGAVSARCCLRPSELSVKRTPHVKERMKVLAWAIRTKERTSVFTSLSVCHVEEGSWAGGFPSELVQHYYYPPTLFSFFFKMKLKF